MSEAICTKCQYLGDAAPCDECYFKGNGHSAFTPPAPPTKTGEIKLPVRYDAERAMVYDAGGGLLLNNLFTPDLACEREYEEWKAEKDRFGQAIADALNTRTAEREALANVTRFEVIDEVAGRIVVRYGVRVEQQIQDEGRTLKVFLAAHHQVS